MIHSPSTHNFGSLQRIGYQRDTAAESEPAELFMPGGPYTQGASDRARIIERRLGSATQRVYLYRLPMPMQSRPSFKYCTIAPCKVVDIYLRE